MSLVKAAVAALIAVVACASARAQPIATPTIAGMTVHCTDATGTPVFTLPNPGVTDVAMSTVDPGTGMRLIEINPALFRALPPLLELFAYAHECGHHISGDVVTGVVFHHDNPVREQNADRIGIRMMRDQLGITLAQARQIGDLFKGNPGVPGYLPGPLRRIWIVECYKTNDNNCDLDLTYSYTATYPDFDVSSDFCAGLTKVASNAASNFSSMRAVHNVASDEYYSNYLISDMDPDAYIDSDSYTIYNDSSSADSLKSSVDGCLSGWTEHERQGRDGTTYTYHNSDDSVEVRLVPFSAGGSALVVENMN